MRLRILELGPRGHAERIDDGDERTGGRLLVDDNGVVHWRPYALREGEHTATHTGPLTAEQLPGPEVAPAATDATSVAEDVEPTFGSQTGPAPG